MVQNILSKKKTDVARILFTCFSFEVYPSYPVFEVNNLSIALSLVNIFFRGGVESSKMWFELEGQIHWCRCCTFMNMVFFSQHKKKKLRLKLQAKKIITFCIKSQVGNKRGLEIKSSRFLIFGLNPSTFSFCLNAWILDIR